MLADDTPAMPTARKLASPMYGRTSAEPTAPPLAFVLKHLCVACVLRGLSPPINMNHGIELAAISAALLRAGRR